jgi:hypothetical protein
MVCRKDCRVVVKKAKLGRLKGVVDKPQNRPQSDKNSPNTKDRGIRSQTYD